jgi:hypothetical protein
MKYHPLQAILAISSILLLAGKPAAQGRFKAFHQAELIEPVLAQFSTNAKPWPATPNAKAEAEFPRDTIPGPELRIWQINSREFNLPIYAVYADTNQIVRPQWRSEKNYLFDLTKYGPCRVMMFFYGDGVPLKKSDVSILRKDRDIPGW